MPNMKSDKLHQVSGETRSSSQTPPQMESPSSQHPLSNDEPTASNEKGYGMRQRKISSRTRKGRRISNPLRDLRIPRSYTLEELAEQTDLSPSYLSRLESGSRRLNADIMQRLARALSCHPGELLIPDPQTGQSWPATTNSALNINEPFGAQPPAHDLPLYTIRPADNGEYVIDFSQPNEWIGRASELAGVSRAYALKVADNAMAPRYCIGERLLVHPSKALRSNCSVVIMTNDQKSIIGKFAGWKNFQNISSKGAPVEADQEDRLILSPIGAANVNVDQSNGIKIEGENILLPRKCITSIARIIGMIEDV
jgi:DNA-binding Xre family transcriptional regulator